MTAATSVIEDRLYWAFRVAGKSKEPTQVGCIIVTPTGELAGVGWNIAPVPKALSRDARRPYSVHAETNALIDAYARQDEPESLVEHTAYVTHHPCVSCMSQLALAGITRVIYADMPDPDTYDHADLAHAANTLCLSVIPHSYTTRRPA